MPRRAPRLGCLMDLQMNKGLWGEELCKQVLYDWKEGDQQRLHIRHNSQKPAVQLAQSARASCRVGSSWLGSRRCVPAGQLVQVAFVKLFCAWYWPAEQTSQVRSTVGDGAVACFFPAGQVDHGVQAV